MSAIDRLIEWLPDFLERNKCSNEPPFNIYSMAPGRIDPNAEVFQHPIAEIKTKDRIFKIQKIMPQYKPETILKMAAEEIKEVLRKYDIAGAVSLHAPGHGEFFVHLNPSYSCAYMYNENEVRFYSKRENYSSLDDQLQKQADTSNMLRLLMDLSAQNFGVLQHLSGNFDELVGAHHSPITHKK